MFYGFVPGTGKLAGHALKIKSFLCSGAATHLSDLKPHKFQSGGIWPLSTRLLGGVDLGDVGKEVEDAAGVAPLVVVPADELDKVLVERDAGLGIEDGRGRVAIHVGGDDVFIGVGENAWTKKFKLASHSAVENFKETYPSGDRRRPP
jgi:hypothetical protein